MLEKFGLKILEDAIFEQTVMAAVKLPLETELIASTSFSRRRFCPMTTIWVSARVCKIPYANAAARVPPPENVKISKSSSERLSGLSSSDNR